MPNNFGVDCFAVGSALTWHPAGEAFATCTSDGPNCHLAGVVRALLAAGSVFKLSAGMGFANMVRYIDLDDLMHVRIIIIIIIILISFIFFSKYIPVPAKMRCRDSIACAASADTLGSNCQQSNVIFCCNTYKATNYPRIT